jgi:hypothetical protein
MKTTRAAKVRAIQKIRTWAARLSDDQQQEQSHFDRLPLHLQLHIREVALEASARDRAHAVESPYKAALCVCKEEHEDHCFMHARVQGAHGEDNHSDKGAQGGLLRWTSLPGLHSTQLEPGCWETGLK